MAQTFTCVACHKPANTISVESSGLGPGDCLQIEGLMAKTVYQPAANFDAVRRALEAHDIRALYGLDSEWAPCYCPICDATYCGDHWRQQLVFDDDFPGFYDCTYGTCPAGHRRILDD